METWASELLMGGQHGFVNGVALLWIGSAAVSAMRAPNEKSSQGYCWLYRFCHLLAANLDRAGLLTATPALTALDNAQQPNTH